MIDKAKRATLKSAALGASSVILGLSSTTSAAHYPSEMHDSSLALDAEPARFKVYTRISSKSNDVEVVIKNVGSDRSTITQITPSETVTERGRFDFSALLADGDLVLETGEHVTVPLIPNTVVADSATAAKHRAHSLDKALRASLSIVTEHQAFAIADIDSVVRFT